MCLNGFFSYKFLFSTALKGNIILCPPIVNPLIHIYASSAHVSFLPKNILFFASVRRFCTALTFSKVWWFDATLLVFLFLTSSIFKQSYNTRLLILPAIVVPSKYFFVAAAQFIEGSPKGAGPRFVPGDAVQQTGALIT
jgi:hypothetical protein